MNIFSGQDRRAWLDRQGQNALDNLQYYAGPGLNLNALVQFADMFNPIGDMTRAGTSARGVVRPGASVSERVGALGSMLTDVASVTAPMAGAAYAGDAARGLTEGLANLTMPADDMATRFLADQDGAIRAWHGSPHDFDRFSMDKIGTGEGAQAYGHGLYFAENKNVASSYKDLMPMTDPTDAGLFYARAALSDSKFNTRGAVDFLNRKRAETEAARGFLMPGAAEKTIADIDDAIRRIEAGEFRPGRLYEVNIDANPEDFLDWDAPLSAQGDIGKAVRRLVNERLGTPEYPGDPGWSRKETGAASYGALAPESRWDKTAATARLREAGIPGIRYLDAGSRSAQDVNDLRVTVGMWRTAARKSPNDEYAQQMLRQAEADLAAAEGNLSRNYVVFDDRLVDILGKDGQRNTPQGRAQEVLDYLTSGRASEVTDDMLAAADPQYLFRNYDLPMDEASRMARAREMGFDTDTPLYHGTDQQFDAFDLDAPGMGLPAVFTSENPELARTYGASVKELFSRAEQPIEFDLGGGVMTNFDGENLTPANLVRRIQQERENIAGYGFDPESEVGMTLNNAGYDHLFNTDIDSVIMRDTADSLHLLGGPKGTNRAIFDPSMLRYTSARFDPRLAHLRNLSAGVGGLGLMASQSEEERSDDIQAILTKYGVEY